MYCHVEMESTNVNVKVHIYVTSQVCSLLWSEEYKELISGHGFMQNQLIIWKYPSMSKAAELTGSFYVVDCCFTFSIFYILILLHFGDIRMQKLNVI